MFNLSVTALVIGLLALAGGLFAVFSPSLTRKGIENFPRSVWPGRVLLAIDMVWAAYAITTLHLGGFDSLKIHLYWLTPVCIALGIIYLDELLSVRALGGLLLLVAAPILNGARWHPSAWRLVITTITYFWIVAGIVFVLEPWWFRKASAFFIKDDARIKTGGIVKACFGVVLILLAVFVYR